MKKLKIKPLPGNLLRFLTGKFLFPQEHSKPTGFYLGESGHGRAFHPWDNLSKCRCGCYPWMVGKDGKDYRSGAPYKIICLKCHAETRAGSIPEIKEEWREI